ncbi:glycosidase [Maribacter polysiphoniae]|uniref:4-O-beta-D-mannosyl-D-glucose phosphorylase n=1 Tax=Maribacter polysiphoniae TaxID=429344 RepID=A0A316DVU2_9FLAO|nr:glycosidase [Maribacter polysiphoniae]MBD1262264.1 glycosidase [Maribacter polysiphoniae]PWK21472.1 4-O-beta-D-mannosyl-D-glucose phosphorylase [Maribacter polysiphoniae]
MTKYKNHSNNNLIQKLFDDYKKLIGRKNIPLSQPSGLFTKYKHPILTAAHAPIHWQYDLNIDSNPHALERIGINATFNAGAIKWNNAYVLAVRVEGKDRKSFFAFAESENGVDNFEFWEEPLLLPQTDDPDINVYDMRLTMHEDGYVYGIFCTERKDPNTPKSDTSSAIANAGIIRSKDLKTWERMPDLLSDSNQQRNVTLHPEFVCGKYAVYTRPQDGFIETGAGGGIGLGYIDDMKHPQVMNEVIINPKEYHTVYELKNGQGPSPIKTKDGWLHLAHGVRNTAAGLRYVLYLFMTALDDITKVIYQPAGYFMAPDDQEIIGDVGNVLFSNGWIPDDNGDVYIYYASSDTRMHVAKSTLDILVDYCKNTPKDNLSSSGSVGNIHELIKRNKGLY